MHCHTYYSPCSSMRPAVLIATAKKRGMNGIVIVDHHTMKGAALATKLNKGRDFEIVTGMEISTNQGDVLGYYLNKDIKSREFFSVVDEIHKQGGLVVIPHPFRTSLNPNHTFKIPLPHVKGNIDAIETFNARMLFNSDNLKSKRIAENLRMAQTAGSDAHFAFEVATGYTEFDGSLHDAIRKRKTVPHGRLRFGAVGGLMSFIKKRI